MKTLRHHLPREFMEGEYNDAPAYELRDVEVIAKHDGSELGWPGKHTNVHWWYELANGKCVGWNENPARGWSFPVMATPKKSCS